MLDENEEAVLPQEPQDHIEEPQGEVNDQSNDFHEESTSEKTMVPLSALQKERAKKRELELELQFERQKNIPKPNQIDDDSRYETATREDIMNAQGEAIRAIEERLWIKQNPEKYEKVNEYLPQFLKQRPNLASAINLASNRYEEAYILMDALTPKQQQQLRQTPQKKEAPHAPSGVPKAAAMNAAVDVMNMSDQEFAAWRSSQRRRR